MKLNNNELHVVKIALNQRKIYLNELISLANDEVFISFLRKEQKEITNILKRIQ